MVDVELGEMERLAVGEVGGHRAHQAGVEEGDVGDLDM